MVRCNVKALRGDFDGRDGYGDTSDGVITWDYMILDEKVRTSAKEIIRCTGHIGTSSLGYTEDFSNILTRDKEPERQNESCQYEDEDISSKIQTRNVPKPYERSLLPIALLSVALQFKITFKKCGHFLLSAVPTFLEIEKRVEAKIAPYFLRHLESAAFPESENKEECKLLRKNDLIVWLCLSECQENLYRAFLNSNAAEETLATRKQVLSTLTVMKKICDHPLLLTKRAANEIAEGMEGFLDTEDIQVAEAMTRSLAGMVEGDEDRSARSCKMISSWRYL